MNAAFPTLPSSFFPPALRFSGKPGLGKTAYLPCSANPIHNQHVKMAENAARQFGFDKVVLVPVYSPPHKDSRQMAPFADRIEMIRRAIRNRPRLAVSDIEGRLPLPSYTVQTMRALVKNFDTAKQRIPFIIGADALKEFATWRDAELLLNRLLFLAAPRGRDKVPRRIDVNGKSIPVVSRRLRIRDAGISSTLVRERVRQGEPIGDLVPPAVETYIREKKLYR